MDPAGLVSGVTAIGVVWFIVKWFTKTLVPMLVAENKLARREFLEATEKARGTCEESARETRAVLICVAKALDRNTNALQEANLKRGN